LGIERGLHGWIGLSWVILLVLRFCDSTWGSDFVELDMLELCEIGLKGWHSSSLKNGIPSPERQCLCNAFCMILSHLQYPVSNLKHIEH